MGYVYEVLCPAAALPELWLFGGGLGSEYCRCNEMEVAACSSYGGGGGTVGMRRHCAYVPNAGSDAMVLTTALDSQHGTRQRLFTMEAATQSKTT
ncbi:hypothetical protein LMG29542_07966 [Paraburkholderia humisilvae]|uniref:Uncharacterized protein n=1 Tax=Paraburkholderia humisilvae TaxID=627669 RepID=A0A6J5F6S8_9BURK|nr:hypothetical protein LMG29542_07966 [Paraburkholderia humisilvae]